VRAATVAIVTKKPVLATRKVRRGGGKRGPSYQFGDNIEAEIRSWAAANKGASPLPKLTELWTKENPGAKKQPCDETFRRYLRRLGLRPGTGSSQS
jgi:hypothetical protein